MATKARGIFLFRVILGWGFLFAGLDKLFALGGKPFSAAGFLTHATGGTWPGVAATTIVNPTHSLWVSLGGSSAIGLINTLVVVGEIAVGLCLVLGLATRFAGIIGAIMIGLFYVASWDFANGIVNEQALYVVGASLLAYLGAGAYYGLDAVIEKSTVVAKVPALKYLVA